MVQPLNQPGIPLPPTHTQPPPQAATITTSIQAQLRPTQCPQRQSANTPHIVSYHPNTNAKLPPPTPPAFAPTSSARPPDLHPSIVSFLYLS